MTKAEFNLGVQKEINHMVKVGEEKAMPKTMTHTFELNYTGELNNLLEDTLDIAKSITTTAKIYGYDDYSYLKTMELIAKFKKDYGKKADIIAIVEVEIKHKEKLEAIIKQYEVQDDKEQDLCSDFEDENFNPEKEKWEASEEQWLNNQRI